MPPNLLKLCKLQDSDRSVGIPLKEVYDRVNDFLDTIDSNSTLEDLSLSRLISSVEDLLNFITYYSNKVITTLSNLSYTRFKSVYRQKDISFIYVIKLVDS